MADALDLAQLKLPAESEIPALLRLCRDVEGLRLHDGDVLLQEGEEGRDLYLLLRGSFVIEKTGDGATPRPLATLEVEPETPAIVGEMAYFGAEARTASVRCVGAGQALRLTPKHVDRVLEALPGLTRLLFRQFTLRLQETSSALREIQSRLDLGAQRRMAQAGETLLEAGRRGGPLLQLAMGRLRMGDRLVGPSDLPGGFLFPEAWLRNAPWPATVTVEDPSFLGEIPADRKEAFIAGQAPLVLSLLKE